MTRHLLSNRRGGRSLVVPGRHNRQPWSAGSDATRLSRVVRIPLTADSSSSGELYQFTGTITDTVGRHPDLVQQRQIEIR